MQRCDAQGEVSMSDVALMYFYETAMLGTMRLASDKIGVAVSSISRQIAQLEQEFGMPLIERGRRTIKLTPAGELALEYHRYQLAAREAFLNRLAELRDFRTDRKRVVSGKSVSVRVDLGGRRIIIKKTETTLTGRPESLK